MNLNNFLREQKRWRRYSPSDLEIAANEIILAADGNISRATAKRYARAALEGVGLEKIT